MLLALERRYRPEEMVLHPFFLPLPPALRPPPPVPRPLPKTGTLRVLVTGATGFLGSYVVRRLVQQGAAVTATGRDARRGAALGLRGASRFVAVDLGAGDAAALGALCAGQHAVIHCAALCKPWPLGASEAHRRSIVVATLDLLTASVAAGVGRFVHISTPSLYFSADYHAYGASGAGAAQEAPYA